MSNSNDSNDSKAWSEAWPTDDVEVTGVAEEAPPDLAAVTKLAAELKDEINKLDVTLKQKKEQLDKTSLEILHALEFMDLDSIKAHGYLFYKEHKTSVTTPKTVEEKAALFDYLQQEGLFLEMASVNSQTLNALYKSLAEEAAAQGNVDFRLPGVAEPTIYTNLKLRRS